MKAVGELFIVACLMIALSLLLGEIIGHRITPPPGAWETPLPTLGR